MVSRSMTALTNLHVMSNKSAKFLTAPEPDANVAPDVLITVMIMTNLSVKGYLSHRMFATNA